MEIEQLAEKEIARIEEILKELKVTDSKGLELYNIILSYFTDSKSFLKKRDFLRAFETAVICWAYCDAGIHLNVFSIDDKLKKYFTIE
jgi:hypothetical protein